MRWLVAFAAVSAFTATAHADELVLVPREDALPVQAKVGEAIELDVMIERTVGRRTIRETLPRGAEVAFLRVTPRLEHQTTPSPNRGLRAFSNAVLFGPHHGDWIGFDTLEYEETPLAENDCVEIDGARVSLSCAPAAGGAPRGAGSVWISAAATLPDGTVLRAPGATDVDRFGLRNRVARVSFRTGDDYLGWLSTYVHVPMVFGSSGRGGDHQTDRYVGADCADVLVGALRASGRSEAYTSVSGVESIASPILFGGSDADPQLRSANGVYSIGEDGVVRDGEGAEVSLEFGRDLAPGDLVTLDYTDDTSGALPRAWDHIGALVGDTNQDGLFGGADTYRNMTDRGLRDVRLMDDAPIRVRFYRLREARRAARGRSR